MTVEKELVVLLADRAVALIAVDRQLRLRCTYDETWRTSEGAFPLSLSMPLAVARHSSGPVEAFLWGLLPDNQGVLDRWARRFQVSARSPFALLTHVGEDCAGAVQFVRPERLDEFLAPGAPHVDWLDEAAIAQRLRDLRRDPSASRNPDDRGKFSLAGAQPKTALLLAGGRWGVPSGRTPTTHILKPPVAGLEGHAENEHFCLALARALGLPTATSEVRRFEDEVAIVVERYDRVHTAGQTIVRVHQEDLCQALAVLPTSKYQNEGGPSPVRIVELLRAHSSSPTEDSATFRDVLAFNWLIGGTDGHAKNYSLLHARGPVVRLAPLYDLASALPYNELDQERLKLAMKTGDKYRLRHIGRADWEKLAREVGWSPGETVERVAALAARLPEKVSRVRDRAHADGLTHPLIDRLTALLTERAEHCLRALAG